MGVRRGLICPQLVQGTLLFAGALHCLWMLNARYQGVSGNWTLFCSQSAESENRLRLLAMVSSLKKLTPASVSVTACELFSVMLLSA